MILATAGHIDHGKTALIKALTGIDADRLPEEKQRGMTIDLGFAYGALPDGTEIGFVDVPGHERFLPNMLAGILSIDRVLLVVAADDGPRPQTLEHLSILELTGVSDLTAVITKIDRVPPNRIAEVAAETQALLADAGFAASPILPVSSRTGDGMAALIAHLELCGRGNSGAAPVPDSEAALFRMPVDRAFTLPGIGTVVTGTVAAGNVRPGDRLMLSPRGTAARVRSVHSRNAPVAGAGAGERCGINIAGDFPDGASPWRGEWLMDPALHAPSGRIDLDLRASRFAAEPLRDGMPVHLHIGTADIVGKLGVLGARHLAPGARGFVQVTLEHPVAAIQGDRIVLRDHAARHTIGGGHVVDPSPPRRGRARSERLASLAAQVGHDTLDVLQRLLAQDGLVDLAAFARRRGLGTPAVEKLADSAGIACIGKAGASISLTAARRAGIEADLLTSIGRHHAAHSDMLGPSRLALVQGLRSRHPEAALDFALAELLDRQEIRRSGGILHLPGHEPRLAQADERLWRRVQPLLAGSALRAPRIRELADALTLAPEAVEALLCRAERLGRVVQIAENRFFMPETLVRLAEIAASIAAESPDGVFTAAAYKDRSGIGRNLAIQVLEYLDRAGITRREGAARRVVRSAEEVLG